MNKYMFSSSPINESSMNLGLENVEANKNIPSKISLEIVRRNSSFGFNSATRTDTWGK